MNYSEKYFEDEDELNQFVYNLIKYMFENLGYYEGDSNNLEKTIKNFLQQPVKPQLTEDERVILKNIDKKYRTILRQHKNIWIAENNDGIRIYHGYCLDYYNSNLFQFIKER